MGSRSVQMRLHHASNCDIVFILNISFIIIYRLLSLCSKCRVTIHNKENKNIFKCQCCHKAESMVQL